MKKILLSIIVLTTLSFGVRAQSWDEIIKAVASDRETDDFFGFSVSISDNKAIVGAHGEDNKAGSAYIFELTNGVWSETAKLVASDRSIDDQFGFSVSISGNKAIVGARLEDEDVIGGSQLTSAGSAYVFELSGGTWTETAKLVASDRLATAQFGVSVSIDGDKAIVGAYQDHQDAVVGGPMMSDAGSAYIFELNGSSWAETAKLVASDRESNDDFGRSVCISGNKVIVGANEEDEDASGGTSLSNAGSAYIFELNGSVWSEMAKLVASDRAINDLFGLSVSISSDKAIVGSHRSRLDASGGNSLVDAGAAYVFELSGGVWTESAKLVASDRATSDAFGVNVSISGDKVVVGSANEDEDASGGATLLDAGSMYIFELSVGVWGETTKLVASDRAAGDLFGRGVSISGSNVIVGAYREDQNVLGVDSLSDAGSVYLFQLSSSVGLNDLGLENSVSIYPNPVKSQIFIDSDKNIKSIEIIDIMGKTIKTRITNNSINVSHLTKGVYFLKIETNKGLVTKKIIKE